MAEGKLPSSRSLTVGTLLIAGSNVLSRLLGLARDALLARAGGTSFQTDAYNIAFLLPDLLNHFLGAGLLSITLIPLLTPAFKRDDLDGVSRTVSEIFGVVFGAVTLLALLCFLFAGEIVPHLTEQALPPETLALTVRYTRILVFAQIFFVAGGFLMAVQYGRYRYAIPALAPLVYNASIIAGGAVALATGDVACFCWGVLFGAFAGNFGIQWFGARRAGLRLRPVVDFKSPALRRYLWLTLPFVFGAGATFSNELAYRYFGGAGEGNVAGLGFGLRIMMSLVGVFGGAAGVASYPVLARHCDDGDWEGLAKRVATTLERIFCLLVPATLAIGLLAPEAVSLYLGGGKFGDESVRNVVRALRFYLPVAVPMSATLIVARSFYASKDTWTPSLLTLGAFLATLPFYALFGEELGDVRVPVLSFATALLQISLLGAFWARRHPSREHLRPILALLKMALPMALLAWGASRGLELWSRPENGLFFFLELALWGCGLYLLSLLLLWPLRIPGFQEWTAALKRKALRRRC